MFEKVNPSHPDKIADRIAGAIVDLAYSRAENPKVAAEVLIGHGICFVIVECGDDVVRAEDLRSIVDRITGRPDLGAWFNVEKQNKHLADNQIGRIRCGDNGIFKGVPLTEEQKELSRIARTLYSRYPYDGKYLIDGDHLTICQSNASEDALTSLFPHAYVNPLGYWSGGIDVDSGATNRKLVSDMGDGITGGGLHGKDLSKADVTINIWCFLEAQRRGKTVTASCSIGDTIIYVYIDGSEEPKVVYFSQMVSEVHKYIDEVGGFEKFAEWGLV